MTQSRHIVELPSLAYIGSPNDRFTHRPNDRCMMHCRIKIVGGLGMSKSTEMSPANGFSFLTHRLRFRWLFSTITCCGAKIPTPGTGYARHIQISGIFAEGRKSYRKMVLHFEQDLTQLHHMLATNSGIERGDH
jgi:hypothetical protein